MVVTEERLSSDLVSSYGALDSSLDTTLLQSLRGMGENLPLPMPTSTLGYALDKMTSTKNRSRTPAEVVHELFRYLHQIWWGAPHKSTTPNLPQVFLNVFHAPGHLATPGCMDTRRISGVEKITFCSIFEGYGKTPFCAVFIFGEH